jgi:hypothetical protein
MLVKLAGIFYSKNFAPVQNTPNDSFSLSWYPNSSAPSDGPWYFPCFKMVYSIHIITTGENSNIINAYGKVL